MILADTSAWIEFDRATGSSVDLRVAELISTGGPLAITEPVMMEVIAGARTRKRAVDLRNLLLSFELLRFDPVVDFEGAAEVYQRCRRAGVTPRGMIDCMIVAVALRYGASILAADGDFGQVCPVVGVELDR